MGHHWGLYAGEWHDWICILETIVQREIWRQSQTTVNCGLHAIIQERDCGLELRWLQWEGIGKRGWRDLQKLSSKLFGDWLDIGGQERESLTTPKFPSWETLVGMVVPAYRLRANRMYLSGCTQDSQVRMLVLQWIGGSKGFPVAQLVKNPPAMWETWVPSLGRGRSPGRGQGNPLQYSCLENPMDRGGWRAVVHRVTQSRTRLKWLSSNSSRGF